MKSNLINANIVFNFIQSECKKKRSDKKDPFDRSNSKFNGIEVKDVATNFNIDIEDARKIILTLVEQGKIIETIRRHYVDIESTSIRLCKVVSKGARGIEVVLLNCLNNSSYFIYGNKVGHLIPGDLIYVDYDKRSDSVKFLAVFKFNKYVKGNFFKNGRDETYTLSEKIDNNYEVTIDKTKRPESFEVFSEDLVLLRIVERECDVNSRLFLKVEEVKIIARHDEVGSDITSLILSYDAPIEFSPKTLEELKYIPDSVSEEEIKDRKDYRDQVVVTIDGSDALDFDDAISVKRFENGNFLLTVHIADVSYYVTENSALDADAEERGTSIYVADRVVNMLPTKLSNGICSLNPNEDRLTLSVEMMVDSSGRITYSEVFRGVINSKARLTYDQVNKFIKSLERKKSGDEKDVPSNEKEDLTSLPTVAQMLIDAYKCAKALRQFRESKGVINFDSDEMKFFLDEKGNPIRVSKRKQEEGEKLIEDFMIAANIQVATLLEKNEIPTLFRNHENPPDDKLPLLRQFLLKLNLLKDFPRTLTPKAINKFIHSIEDDHLRKVVSKMVLRSMSKAFYSPSNLGHFGLNEKDYLHFTSPIRRYPDLLVHRCVKHYLLDKDNFDYDQNYNALVELGNKTSEAERRAQKIEYAVNDLETCKYFSSRIGYTYHAFVDGFNSAGMFIETDIGLEGFLPFILMEDDCYHFNSKEYEVISKFNKVTYRVGDPIDIVVFDADMDLMRVTFCLKSFYDGFIRNFNDNEVKLYKEDSSEFLSNQKYMESRRKYIEFLSSSKEKKTKFVLGKNNPSKTTSGSRSKNGGDKSSKGKHKSAYKQSRSFSKNKERRQGSSSSHQSYKNNKGRHSNNRSR